MSTDQLPVSLDGTTILTSTSPSFSLHPSSHIPPIPIKCCMMMSMFPFLFISTIPMWLSPLYLIEKQCPKRLVSNFFSSAPNTVYPAHACKIRSRLQNPNTSVSIPKHCNLTPIFSNIKCRPPVLATRSLSLVTHHSPHTLQVPSCMLGLM